MSIRGAICEIQVTTVAAHLFNELDHDRGYKDHGQELSAGEQSLLGRIRRLMEVADEEVSDLARAYEETKRAHVTIETPEALRFVLENEVGRSLTGEFNRLHQILESTVTPLTRDTMVGLAGDPAEVLEQGRAVAEGLRLGPANDVIYFVLGCQALRNDLARIVRSWRGPKTALRVAIERWIDDGLD
jgi:hypothetical protein